VSTVPDISRYTVAKTNIDLMLSDVRSGRMPQGNTKKVTATEVEVLKSWKSDGLKP
jgi:uncharacterized membrane protein